MKLCSSDNHCTVTHDLKYGMAIFLDIPLSNVLILLKPLDVLLSTMYFIIAGKLTITMKVFFTIKNIQSGWSNANLLDTIYCTSYIPPLVTLTEWKKINFIFMNSTSSSKKDLLNPCGYIHCTIPLKINYRTSTSIFLLSIPSLSPLLKNGLVILLITRLTYALICA